MADFPNPEISSERAFVARTVFLARKRPRARCSVSGVSPFDFVNPAIFGEDRPKLTAARASPLTCFPDRAFRREQFLLRRFPENRSRANESEDSL